MNVPLGMAINPTRILSRKRAAEMVEEARQALPTSMYLNMLHEAAVTGKLPCFTRGGDRAPNMDAEVSPRERMDLLKYLINKVMPDPKVVEVTENVAPEELENEKQLSRLSTDALRSLVHQAQEYLKDEATPIEARPNNG